MLIYSANKEFLGIDEKDLTTLGFKDFLELRAEVADFADLFVKTPGYIHNFKHVHWIDFISYSDSSEDAQVIINVNSKNFKSKISIEPLFLTQNPSLQSYIVSLNNLRELTKKESENISADISLRPIPQSAPLVEKEVKVDTFDAPKKEIIAAATVKIDPYETPLEVDFDFEEVYEEVVPQTIIKPQAVLDDILDVGDLSLDTVESVPKTHTNENLVAQGKTLENGYVYNPQVASDELGLPLDLIEEFIQDFIVQAKEFEENIYTALDASEFEQVKILSHKLKGVAANLRIEDAFDTLSIVNTSNDINVIKENLDGFYKIIAKLSGEEPVTESVTIAAVQEKVPQKDEIENDLYADLLTVEDSQVPQKIELAELADDEFTSSDVDFSTLDKELEKIEDIELLELDKEINLDENISFDFAEDVVDIDAIVEEEALEVVEYSKESVAAEIGIDKESFMELFEDYISEGHDILAAMRRSAEQGDFKSSAHEAMKLQGMSDNMRIKSFDKELEIAIGSTQKDEVIGSINKIERIISHISSTGV